ncbi:helix-turn-helix domain-containing protein [Paractinoplanes atraurantiacus]|uniref:Helix-turn-helix domain-containing protein n=1 Tax=Paractinoplanes atraurantiacus TaxID=1036182 RepID=A0A285IJ54_9ACTN|nr:helix-turn-helix domain-containing protein [Actinoplanes atraurantiacus]SNY46991.1 Helix-turn-helix domain-containing protein [Actinoplanes atraurantiacus]
MESFGELIRRLRTGAGLTLEQLAEASGVTDRAISDMERGVSRGPRVRTVAALADGLGLTGGEREALLAAARAGRTGATATQLPLPSEVADFTGRAAELAQVRAWSSGAVVVISGDAGVGKTTFAGRAAQAWPERLFVDLRGLDEEPLTAVAVLDRLIRAVDPGRRSVPPDADEASALWQTLIRGRRLVVVLDNAIGESHVRPVLPSQGPAVVLVTSRRSLSGLEDVHRIRLGPLPEAESVALLNSIISASPSPSSSPSHDQLRRIADLCVHVPLALRIAGNRLLRGAADELIARLATGDPQVTAAIDLSYQQLSGPSRRLFRRLALVPGTSTGPELAAVLAEEPLLTTEDALDDLVDLSLLQQRPDGRLEFHDLLRLYASEALDREEGPNDRAAIVARRDDWLLDTAIVAGRHFEPDFGPGRAGTTDIVEFTTPAGASAWLQAESENWLAALRTAGDERVIEVAESLHWYSDSWFAWPGWEDVFTLSCAAADRLGDDRLRAVHEGYLVWVYVVVQHRVEEALEHARRALDAAERAGDLRQVAWARYYVAWSLQLRKRRPEAVAQISRAVAEFREAGDREGAPNGLLMWANILADMGEPGEAATLYREIITTVTDPATAPPQHIADFAQAAAHQVLSDIEAAAKRWPEALDAATREIELRERQGENVGAMVRALTRRAAIHVELGDLEAARSDMTAFETLRDRAGEQVTEPGPVRDRIEKVYRALASSRDAHR